MIYETHTWMCSRYRKFENIGHGDTVHTKTHREIRSILDDNFEMQI